MNIKNLKPNKNARTKQGYFNVSESTKYNGTVKKVIYRSSWEEMFCIWCERNSNITQWSSESITIKYFNPISKTIRNYFPDFVVRTKDNQTWLVEVKPDKDTKPPTKPKRKTKKAMMNYNYAMETFLVNDSKFKSAKAFCKERNWVFFIADEKWFKVKK